MITSSRGRGVSGDCVECVCRDDFLKLAESLIITALSKICNVMATSSFYSFWIKSNTIRCLKYYKPARRPNEFLLYLLIMFVNRHIFHFLRFLVINYESLSGHQNLNSLTSLGGLQAKENFLGNEMFELPYENKHISHSAFMFLMSGENASQTKEENFGGHQKFFFKANCK